MNVCLQHCDTTEHETLIYLQEELKRRSSAHLQDLWGAEARA